MGALIELNYCILPRKGKLLLYCRYIAADCHYIIGKYNYITRKLLKCLGTLTGG